jgi:prepilin-type N-terminal cleavage/methylation domain-containing protein
MSKQSTALRHQRGFTIVELLIVIVVIAILAAIVIVAYTGIQNKAHAAAAQSAATDVTKLLSIYNTNNGTYPTDLTTVNNGQPMPTSGGTSYAYHPGAGNTSYCATVTNGNSSYKVTDTATTPVTGGCPGDGVGGVAAITNLSTNPSVENDTTGWSPRWFGAGGGSGTSTQTAAAAHSGAFGYRKTWTVAGGGQDIGMQYTVGGLTAGTTYTFSAYVRSSLATGQKMFTQWRDGSGAAIGGNIFGSEVAVGANTWQQLSQTLTAPAGTAGAIVVWGPYPASGSPSFTVGATIDFDDFMATTGTTTYSYADGNSPNWIWNGTPNSSTSTGPGQ